MNFEEIARIISAVASGACLGTAAGLTTRSVWIGFLVGIGLIFFKAF